MSFEFPGILGVSAPMAEVLRLLKLAAPTEATVLLLGETGTGKEVAAWAIHKNSPRSRGPLVVVNCAALPEPLLESELFGHERGAFSGAVGRKEGRFLLAHHGTLVLDEIAEMSLTTQAKILRVLQSLEFEPLGSTRPVKVDVRIIAATNRDLETMVREGRFRDDLFYRLNVFPILLPPLRERPEDLPELAAYFLKVYCEKNQRPLISLAPQVVQAFRHYPWPGNIRELENTLERGVIMCAGDTLTPEDLPPGLQQYGFGPPEEGELEPGLPELERRLVSRTLAKVSGQRRLAAEILGISLEELNLKLRSYGMEE